jgi:TPR repeat protein
MVVRRRTRNILQNQLVMDRSSNLMSHYRFRCRRPARAAVVTAAVIAAGLATAAPLRAETPAQGCAARATDGDYRVCAAAVALRPADPTLRRLYAISLNKAGHYRAALAQFAEVTRLEPNRFRAQYELGWMLAFVNRYAEAIPPLVKAARLRPKNIAVYRALTISFAAIRRPADALRYALAGARLGDSIAMFDVADHYRNGRGVPRNPALAVLWLERAARAGHVRAMDDLVEVYQYGRLGQTPDDAKAEAWASKAYRARNR